MFSSETVQKNPHANGIAIKNVPLSIIQSLIIIATCFVYYTEINLNTIFITAASSCSSCGRNRRHRPLYGNYGPSCFWLGSRLLLITPSADHAFCLSRLQGRSPGQTSSKFS